MNDWIERDLERLDRREPLRSLDGLETDIWAGVEGRAQALKISKLLYAFQGAILVFALAGSIAAGHLAGASTHADSEFAVFSGRLDIAPSTLLDGAEL